MNKNLLQALPFLSSIFLGGLLTMLSGCASVSYDAAEVGNPFGYSHRQIDEFTCMVVFRGAPSQPPEQVRDLALLRAAELSLELGFPAFVVSSESSQKTLLPASVYARPVLAPGPTRVRFGQVMRDPPRMSGGKTITYEGMRTTLTVRFFTTPPSEPDVHDAATLRRVLRAKYSLR